MDGQSFTQVIFSMGQTAVFFWLFVVGFFFAAVCFLLGEALDGLDDIFHGILDVLHIDSLLHIDVDADTGGGPSIFSPRVVSVFVTIFGAGGFVSAVNGIGVAGSSVIGLVSGLVIATIFFWIFRWIYSQQTSSVVNTVQLKGMSGFVKTEIPANGLGEVVVDYAGLKMTRTAKSDNGKTIKQNSSIIVKEVCGHIVTVSQ